MLCVIAGGFFNMTLDEYISKIEHLYNNIDGVINEILTQGDTKNFAPNIVRQRMRNEGMFPSVGDYKTTQRRAGGARGIKTGAIKLFDKGDFHRGLFVEMDSRKLKLDSQDKKRGLLVQKYGENIFNMKNEEKTHIINTFIIPELRDIVNPKEDITIDIG